MLKISTNSVVTVNFLKMFDLLLLFDASFNASAPPPLCQGRLVDAMEVSSRAELGAAMFLMRIATNSISDDLRLDTPRVSVFYAALPRVEWNITWHFLFLP